MGRARVPVWRSSAEWQAGKWLASCRRSICQIVTIVEAAEKHSISHPRVSRWSGSPSAQTGRGAVVVSGALTSHLDNYQWSKVVLPVTVASCCVLFKRTHTNWPELKGKLHTGSYSYLITPNANVTVGFWGEAWSLTYLIWTREDQAPSPHTDGGLWKATQLVNHAVLAQLFWLYLNYIFYIWSLLLLFLPRLTESKPLPASRIIEGYFFLSLYIYIYIGEVEPFNTAGF